uniref:Protein kinase domain-containing protein n=1 Tax=Rhizophagus irregularis (strain DAOM 181602 / DAOM 197198 / MUCL 43194) TaxID=747089 RepID=U9SHU8_RHIID
MSQIKLTSPLTSKIAFKSIFTNRRKPSIEKKDTNNTEKVDRLETFINENKINCYAYSDFKSVQQINRETSFIKRAILNDEFFVLKSFNNDDETIRQIVCELESLRTIIHENILKFHGIIRIEDGLPNMYKHILVLEYANNGSLSAYLREQINKLDWKNKLSLALQLAKAVSYLHDNDIIHRDLQANEILIHQKSIKLAAFGLPSVVTKDTLSLFDTIPYMDPINFDCIENCELDKRSNVYSIGVLLWQITSGRKPFYTERPDVELAKAIFRGRREETVMGTPMEYSRLYKECWNHEPNKRPDMKRIVSNLNQLLLAENSSPTNSQKEKKDDATKWVENVLKNKKVDFIPLNDLKDPEPLGKGGFGYIKKAIWTRTGKYVVYKRLINTDAVKYNTLDAFIHELKIHLHLSIYSDRIVRCLGISQGN